MSLPGLPERLNQVQYIAFTNLVSFAPHWSDRRPAVVLWIEALGSAELEHFITPPCYIDHTLKHTAAWVLSPRPHARAMRPAVLRRIVTLHWAKAKIETQVTFSSA